MESLGTIFSIISAFGVIFTIVFAILEFRKNASLKRVEFMIEFSSRVRENETIRKGYLMIDLGDKWYTQDFYNLDNINAPIIDRTLAHFSQVAYLILHNFIGKKEKQMFLYQLMSVLTNYQVQAYLFNAYHYSIYPHVINICTYSDEEKHNSSFKELINYGLKYELLPKDFTKESCNLYPKFLK